MGFLEGFKIQGIRALAFLGILGLWVQGYVEIEMEKTLLGGMDVGLLKRLPGNQGAQVQALNPKR